MKDGESDTDKAESVAKSGVERSDSGCSCTLRIVDCSSIRRWLLLCSLLKTFNEINSVSRRIEFSPRDCAMDTN